MDMKQVVDHSAVPDEAICPLCRLLILPEQLVQCPKGHLFCHPCVIRHLRTTKVCPHDEREVLFPEDLSECLLAKRLLSSIEVFCTFGRASSNGDVFCNWKGKMESLRHHLPTCKYQMCPCPNQCTGFDGQLVLIRRGSVVAHLKKICPLAMVSCPNACGKRLRRDALPEHMSVCKTSLLVCPQGCQQFKRLNGTDPKAHLDNCPLTQLPEALRKASIGGILDPSIEGRLPSFVQKMSKLSAAEIPVAEEGGEEIGNRQSVHHMDTTSPNLSRSGSRPTARQQRSSDIPPSPKDAYKPSPVVVQGQSEVRSEQQADIPPPPEDAYEAPPAAVRGQSEVHSEQPADIPPPPNEAPPAAARGQSEVRSEQPADIPPPPKDAHEAVPYRPIETRPEDPSDVPSPPQDSFESPRAHVRCQSEVRSEQAADIPPPPIDSYDAPRAQAASRPEAIRQSIAKPSVPCPNACLTPEGRIMMVPTGDLEHHMSTCKLEEITCLWPGCSDVIKRGDLKEHDEENLHVHLQLLQISNRALAKRTKKLADYEQRLTELRGVGVADKVQMIEALADSMFTRLVTISNEQQLRVPEFVWTLPFEDVVKMKSAAVSQKVCLSGLMFQFILGKRDKTRWKGFYIRKLKCSSGQSVLTSKLHVLVCLLDSKGEWRQDTVRNWASSEIFDQNACERGWERFLSVDDSAFHHNSTVSILIQVATSSQIAQNPINRAFV